MRKLLIAVCVLALMPYVASALTQAEWDVIEKQDAKRAADFEEYKAVRAEAKAAFAEKDYATAAELFEKAASSDHANREEMAYVKAWQLNSAAYSLMLADKMLGHALDLLLEAKRTANKKCLVLVEKNIAYCEENLKK